MLREEGPPPYWPVRLPIYTPPAERTRSLARREAALSHYRRKRQERFGYYGIRPELDIKYAGVRFVESVPYGDARCTLCNAAISEKYRLFFREPEEEDQVYRSLAVAFYPVGNQCIENWALELPDSDDRRFFLEQVEWQKQRARRWQPALPPPPPTISPALEALLDELGDTSDDDW